MNGMTREGTRLLRSLAVRGARLVRDGEAYRVEGGRRNGAARWDLDVVDDLLRRRWLAVGETGIAIVAAGRTELQRLLTEPAITAARPRQQSIAMVTDDYGLAQQVVVNDDESPLAWLRKRRGADGRPLVGAAEFAAGERLRADYTRGRLMPRVTANWDAAVAGKRRDGGGGIADLTDAAFSARRRVERALAAVGPELGGLLVDFCCFLKGLEAVERERRWPPRSAKVVLTVGLSVLARHYGLATQAHGPTKAPSILHWGTEDYRPLLD